MPDPDHALATDIAEALFHASPSFRRQFQTREQLAAVAEAVVSHLHKHKWKIIQEPRGRGLKFAVSPIMKARINAGLARARNRP